MLPSALTRTSVQRDHALIAPDSHVSAPLPAWKKSRGVVLISPRMGARFTQYIAMMEKGGEAAPPAPGVQRLAYVMEGGIDVQTEAGRESLSVGGYVYTPTGGGVRINARKNAKLMIFEKHFVPIDDEDLPRAIVGNEQNLPEAPFLGDERAQLKLLLPDVPAFDMAVNIFTYLPGATLPFVEIHIMEHGLTMIQGEGVYRLSDSWYPVREGDTIWMAPYCPQWFVASGRIPARYIYYKDVNRDPMGGGAGA